MICAANRIPGCYMIRASVEIKKSWETGIFRYFEQSRETFNIVIKQKKPVRKTLMKSSVLLFSYSLYLFNLVFFFLVTESTTLQNSKREGSIKDLMFSMSRFRIPRTLILNTGKQKTISTLYVKLFLTYHLNNCLSSLVVSDYPSSVSGGFGKRAGMFLGISIY